MRLTVRASLFGFSCMTLFTACKKDKNECPAPTPMAVDGRDQFVGRYHVYDTLGTYRYSMEVFKSSAVDSLYFTNWANAFSDYVLHANTDATNFFHFGIYNPAVDSSGHRWMLSSQYDAAFQSNMLVNDTLHMHYRLDNTAYFFEDGAPFYSQIIYEYGVKQ